MDEYFEINSLRPNPVKTEVYAFHLRNKKTNRKLYVVWKSVESANNPNPKYLGVIINRSLTYKVHYEKINMKINTINGLLRKLFGSIWDAEPYTLIIMVLAFSFSIGDFTSSVWERSACTKKIDIALNETC